MSPSLAEGENTADLHDDHFRGWVGLQFLFSPRIVFNQEGNRARAQWNQVSPHGMKVTAYPGNEHKLTAYWYIGKYDNEFIKIDEEWKLLRCHVINFVRTPYDQGWLRQQDCRRKFYPGPQTGQSQFYTYHPDAVYTGDGQMNWGPFLPGDGTF